MEKHFEESFYQRWKKSNARSIEFHSESERRDEAQLFFRARFFSKVILTRGRGCGVGSLTPGLLAFLAFLAWQPFHAKNASDELRETG